MRDIPESIPYSMLFRTDEKLSHRKYPVHLAFLIFCPKPVFFWSIERGSQGPFCTSRPLLRENDRANRWVARLLTTRIYETPEKAQLEMRSYRTDMWANARPIDLFCHFRYKTARKIKRALDLLYRFIKNNPTLDQQRNKKWRQRQTGTCLCGNSWSVRIDMEYGINHRLCWF